MMASRSKKRKALQDYNTTKQVSKPMTIMDVDAAYRKGFTEGYEAGREEGFKQSAMMTIQRTYGAILCAAHELYGFGQDRGVRMLNRMHEVLVEILPSPRNRCERNDLRRKSDGTSPYFDQHQGA